MDEDHTAPRPSEQPSSEKLPWEAPRLVELDIGASRQGKSPGDFEELTIQGGEFGPAS